MRTEHPAIGWRYDRDREAYVVTVTIPDAYVMTTPAERDASGATLLDAALARALRECGVVV